MSFPKTPGAQIGVRVAFVAPGADGNRYTWSARCGLYVALSGDCCSRWIWVWWWGLVLVGGGIGPVAFLLLCVGPCKVKNLSAIASDFRNVNFSCLVWPSKNTWRAN